VFLFGAECTGEVQSGACQLKQDRRADHRESHHRDDRRQIGSSLVWFRSLARQSTSVEYFQKLNSTENWTNSTRLKNAPGRRGAVRDREVTLPRAVKMKCTRSSPRLSEKRNQSPIYVNTSKAEYLMNGHSRYRLASANDSHWLLLTYAMRPQAALCLVSAARVASWNRLRAVARSPIRD
jgi:hypothetical protein